TRKIGEASRLLVADEVCNMKYSKFGDSKPRQKKDLKGFDTFQVLK
ncbi:MAG: hypothetical protein ACI85U_000498, partial [Candidatus Promineifilaceae bacterium]